MRNGEQTVVVCAVAGLLLLGLPASMWWSWWESPGEERASDPTGEVTDPADDRETVDGAVDELGAEAESLAVEVVDGAKSASRDIFAVTLPAIDDSLSRVSRTEIIEEFDGKEPRQFGEFVDGVETRLPTDRRVVALTLDACDRGYDEKLVEFLRRRDIAATLFVSGYWANSHPETLRTLHDDPLFEIANHGLEHRPCSVTGESVAEIEGTGSVEEAYREIDGNAALIEELIGERPSFYRSGTAHYDEICTRIARRTGHRVAGFDVVGDMGATYSADEVEEAITDVESGSIIVAHMNQPGGETLEGLRQALPRLREKGFAFVRLSDLSWN